jgi:hypothetical protein
MISRLRQLVTDQENLKKKMLQVHKAELQISTPIDKLITALRRRKKRLKIDFQQVSPDFLPLARRIMILIILLWKQVRQLCKILVEILRKYKLL